MHVGLFFNMVQPSNLPSILTEITALNWCHELFRISLVYLQHTSECTCFPGDPGAIYIYGWFYAQGKTEALMLHPAR